MHPLLHFVVALFILYCSVSWILPKIVAHLIERKFKVIVRIGRIGIPYLKLCDILIVKGGVTIQIDEIGIRSSFINSELTKLITLVVKDVRIYKEIEKEKTDVENSQAATARDLGLSTPTLLDFQNKKIPHFITIFAQFMAIHVYNVSAILLQSATQIVTPLVDYEKPGWMVHTTANEVHLDGSIVQNARTLLVNINLSEVSVKLLRHPKIRVDEETCLAELGFATSMEATFVAQGALSVERLIITTNRLKTTLNDQFYRFYTLIKSSEIEDEIVSCRLPIACQEEEDIFNRIFPIIPKNFMYKMEDTSLRSVGENRTEFISTLKVITIDARLTNTHIYMSKLEHLPIVYFEFRMLDWQVCNMKEELLLLKSISCDSKLENCNLTANLKLSTLLLTYNHKIMYRWIETNFLRVIPPFGVKSSSSTWRNGRTDVGISKLAQRQKTLFEKLLHKLVASGHIELSQVSTFLNLEDETSYVGFAHTKLIVEQLNYLMKNWQAELLVESMWWSFKEWSQELITSKKTHVWGTPVYLGTILLKLESFSKPKIELLMDTIQLEFNYKLVWHITGAIKCFRQYEKFARSRSTNNKVDGRGFDLESTIINVELNHFNLFLESFQDEYLIGRLNSFLLDKNIMGVTSVKLRGFKVATVKMVTPFVPYNCVRMEDIGEYKVLVKSALVHFKEKSLSSPSLQIDIQLLEEIVVFWSANFQHRIHSVQQQLRQFISLMRQNLTDIESEKINLSDMKKSSNAATINFKISGLFAFHIWISKKHTAKISLNEIEISRTPNDVVVLNKLVIMCVDDIEIFTVRGILFSRILDHEDIRAQRSDNENFQLAWNKTWKLSIEVFKACFPHRHNYAEAVQDELKAIIKWLVSLYRIKPKPAFNDDSPLPSDLLVQVGEFLFEMSDDPFEVKLRENYELLEDEYNESVKRQKMLKAKISELCTTHLHLPAGKLEELYANLKKKNAEIYIQRSKQMQHAGPPRTRLFAWSITNLELMILADPSLHGTENAIEIMRELDNESPWPEDGLQFSTLWCRVVCMRCEEWKFQLRDFRQPLLHIRQWRLTGSLVGAEQLAPRRATRIVEIDLGPPLHIHKDYRSMLPLKFYHDFYCTIESFSYAFGPCWESVIAQCQLTFEKIFAPSRDPSPPLPFWDKMRLLLHGRFMMVVQQLTVLLHASLDPYNTTEEMELTWNEVAMDWSNAKFIYKGDLNIFVRTASKYDDCKLLHLPNLKLIVNLQWVCLGDPNDHHSVVYCNQVPEYSSNHEHDSFRAFRSQNINLGIVLETKPVAASPGDNIGDYPMLSLYSSTLRWIENLKLILSGVTRPTRRGRVFNNMRPRKIQLSRHYKRVHLLMGLHRFQVCYWMSFAMQRGFELLGGRLSSSSEHALSLVPIDDGLKHRPKAAWSIIYMNSELNDAEIWLKSALQEDPEKETISLRQPVEKCFCLSVAKVSYGRETVVMSRQHQTNDQNKDTPTHRLVVYDLKGAWTKSNRNVAFALFDSLMRNQRMKKNLSMEALKGFRKESNSSPLKRRNTDSVGTPSNPTIQTLQSKTSGSPSPLSKIQSGHAANMLKQLIAEADNKAVVFSDDLSSATRQQHLQGLQACQEDDVLHKNWLIALVNAQVLLKGCETKGYVILSSAKAEILQRIHRPVWRDRTLVSKTTWVGSLECLQYYATVNAGENDSINDNIMWLTVDNIQEKESTVISEIPQVPNIVGSGVSVGAVVSDVVGAGGIEENWPIQLQRIVSRCKCEFFYVGYGDISVDTAELGDVPPLPQEDVGLWDRRQTAVDAFTLMHHDLDVCTNSLQYAMLLDIVNNLLLYVEPHRKEALERLARMRFQIQLNSVQDQRRPIQVLQNQIRSAVSKLRKLEKETYLVNKSFAEDPNNLELLQEMERLEELVYNCKGQLNSQSEELDMMISCYKESQLLANSRMATTRNDKPLTIVRANEICFKHAQWRLTEADGQIGIADLVLSNFLYTKNSKSDDSVEHLLELGYVRMTNLLPNQIYKEVLLPTEIQSNMPVEHKRVVRVFCREKPPVGGIAVKEHFEINVVPLTIALTKKFYNTMLKFCFPEKDPETIERERNGSGSAAPDETDVDTRGRKYRSSGRAKRDSNFYIPIDDVEKMKERAEKNKLFIYIKIPEVPVRVSYKGNKEKNLEDIRDFSLVIPTLEYHNVTWTWLDLLLAMKSETRRVILSQAIKQKLQIKRNTGSADESSSPHEEDKAKMLLGARHVGETKNARKGISSVFKSSKLP